MNRMNIPGFTADASLYRTSTRYQSAVNANRNGADQVHPQNWLWEGLKKVGKTVLRVGCRTSCVAAGGAIAVGCSGGSAGALTPGCVVAGVAFEQACAELC